MRSHGSGRIALRFSLLLSLLLAASCCELEFLSPLQFSIHAAESIELRVQVATLASPPPSVCACDTSPVAQLRAPMGAATEVQLWHAGEKIFTQGSSFVVRWPHNGAFTLLATATANQSNPSRSSCALPYAVLRFSAAAAPHPLPFCSLQRDRSFPQRGSNWPR